MSRDSNLEQTFKTFDHHAYEVVFNSDNGIWPEEKKTYLAKNVIHLMDVLEKEKPYPKAHRVKSILEIAYIPDCFVLLSTSRVRDEFRLKEKQNEKESL